MYFIVYLITFILFFTANAFAVPITFLEFKASSQNPNEESTFTFVSSESEELFKNLYPDQKGNVSFDSIIDYSVYDKTGDGLMDYVTFLPRGTYNGETFWARITFATDKLNGINLEPGFYPDAQRASFADVGHPGLDMAFTGSGFNTLSGNFSIFNSKFDTTILDPNTSKFAQVNSFAANWQIGTRLSGKVYYNFDVIPGLQPPFAPFAPFAPNSPESPFSPFAPFAPNSPFSPFAPFSPTLPDSPFSPTPPQSPFAPTLPTAPTPPAAFYAQNNLQPIQGITNPEPMSIILFGVSFPALALLRRKRTGS